MKNELKKQKTKTMKKTIIHIIATIAIVFALPATHLCAGERAGLYNNHQTAQDESVRAGIYNSPAQSSNDLEEFKVFNDLKDDDDTGSLRAGGNMGGGNDNKVPAKDSLLLVLVAAAGYLFWRKKKNQGVF
jgi:flagellar basal body-associated protein FliL